jgi:hypothetical protein
VVAAASVWADDADLLNAATQKAFDEVKASLEKAIAGKPEVAAVKRVGVGPLENDKNNATALLKSALTKTPFNVVLTNEAELTPLLDEFARQVRAKDIILKETAHKLRLQGVDAVLFGGIEKSTVETVKDNAQEGKRATVRILLNLASVAEQNPGSLIWSEQISGSAGDLHAVSFETRAQAFIHEYRIALIIVAVILGLLVLARLYRRAIRPR